MTPQQLAADVVDRLTRAAVAAKAGRADEAQRLLGGIDFQYAKWMPDELLQGIGTCHYLSGNAQDAIRYLGSVRNPDSMCRIAIAEAYRAATGQQLPPAEGYSREDEISDAMSFSGIEYAEDLYRPDNGLDGYRVPVPKKRVWGDTNSALARGDFDAASIAIEAARATYAPFMFGASILRTRSGSVPRWDGQRCKRLVFPAFDGFGDFWLHGRYIAQMREAAETVVVVAHRQVIDLVRHSAPWLHEVRPQEELEAALRGADGYAHSWGLPRVGGFGSPVWVKAPGRADLGEGRHIGIVWRGSGTNANDRFRSIPIAEFAPLLAMKGIVWHSLTAEPRAIDELPPAVIDHSAELRAGGFAQTARLIAGLDLVVAIDSSVANLCGAMGAPVWTLAESDPDFRWGDAQLHGERTPWFPSARVFRQAKGEGWGPVVARVREALAETSAAKHIHGTFTAHSRQESATTANCLQQTSG